jgi:hypothetical protein
MGCTPEIGREVSGEKVGEGDDGMSGEADSDVGIGELGEELSRAVVIGKDGGKIGEERIPEGAGIAEPGGASNAG